MKLLCSGSSRRSGVRVAAVPPNLKVEKDYIMSHIIPKLEITTPDVYEKISNTDDVNVETTTYEKAVVTRIIKDDILLAIKLSVFEGCNDTLHFKSI